MPNGEPEMAVDAGGVLRDCLTQFWSTFYEMYTEGTQMKIPVVSEDLQEEHWIAIAKVLKVGWKQEHYFPIKLARSFMEKCIFNEHITDIVESFLMTLGSDDRTLLKEAMTDFESVNKEELLELFSDLKSKYKPATKYDVLPLIQQVANRELVHKPSFVISCWSTNMDNLMSKESFEKIYESCEPSSKNLLKSFSVSEGEMDSNSAKVFGFLRKFIKEADESTLEKFARFCTGADILLPDSYNKIHITFNKCSGFARRPTAHVCSSTLELPNSYDTFATFKKELITLLNSGVWVMDFV